MVQSKAPEIASQVTDLSRYWVPVKPETHVTVSLVGGAGVVQVTCVVEGTLSGLHEHAALSVPGEAPEHDDEVAPVQALTQKVWVPFVKPLPPAGPVKEVPVPLSRVPDTAGPLIRRR